MTRRVAMLAVGLLVLAVAVAVAVPAAAQTEPPRVKVTTSSDRCANGLPVVDYTLANTQPTAVAVQAWWVADASLYDVADTHQLAPTPAPVAGSFALPLDFFATVTVYATATWPDGKVTTNASWAIPLADCTRQQPSRRSWIASAIEEPKIRAGCRGSPRGSPPAITRQHSGGLAGFGT